MKVIISIKAQQRHEANYFNQGSTKTTLSKIYDGAFLRNYFHKKPPWQMFEEFLIHLWSGHQGCNIIKKRLQHSCFPVKFKFLRTPILENFYEWLLLFWYKDLHLGNIKFTQIAPSFSGVTYEENMIEVSYSRDHKIPVIFHRGIFFFGKNQIFLAEAHCSCFFRGFQGLLVLILFLRQQSTSKKGINVEGCGIHNVDSRS